MDYCLYDEIEYLREAMIRTASKKGFNSNETIEISKKLDELLTQLNDMKKQALDQVKIISCKKDGYGGECCVITKVQRWIEFSNH